MKRKRIAAFMAGLDREYQREFVHGMVEQAQADNVDLCVFNCEGTSGTIEMQEHFTEDFIFALPDLADFDGIAALCATVTTAESRMHLHDLLAAQAGKPQVMIDDDAPQAVRLSFNDQTSLRELSRHLVLKHGFKRFAIITGPRGNPVADDRFNSCMETLAECGVTVDEDMIFDGRWVRVGGERAVKAILESGKQLPEVIVCGNDDIAFGVIDALEERGIHVPDDVHVTGFDARKEAVGRGITSIKRPVHEAGVKTIRMLCDWMKGQKPTQHEILLPTSIVYGDSCGCEANIRSAKEYLRIFSAEHRAIEKSVRRASGFSNAMAAVFTEEDADRVIAHYAKRWDIGEIHVCVDPEFLEGSKHSGTDLAKEMLLVSSHGQAGVGTQIKFQTKKLLPLLEIERESPLALVFCPLYYKERIFGYAVFDVEFAASLALHSFVTMLAGGLMSLRLQAMVRAYAAQVENLSVHDALTGLLNRRGYQQEAQALLDRAKSESSIFAMISVDMDDLKIVNDRFGHLAGDEAIRRMSVAMRGLERLGMLCVHISGDEFLALGAVPDEQAAEGLLPALFENMKRINQESKWVYEIQASVGIYYNKPTANATLEEYQRLADQHMYAMKRKRKAARAGGGCRAE